MGQNINLYMIFKEIFSFPVKFGLLSILFFMLVFISCEQEKDKEKWRHVEISSLDRSQVITIITDGNKRYFIPGRHKHFTPKNGYLLVDISNVDALGDAISVCWNDKGHKWKIASAYAQFIECNLDTSEFVYYGPKDKYGAPSVKGYLGENCGGVLIREDLKPHGNLILSYVGQTDK